MKNTNNFTIQSSNKLFCLVLMANENEAIKTKKNVLFSIERTNRNVSHSPKTKHISLSFNKNSCKLSWTEMIAAELKII